MSTKTAVDGEASTEALTDTMSPASTPGETAGAVTEALLSFAEGRTLIVATHDPALAARMDRVIRLGETP